jgi:GGDEF domain-containing protein
LARAARAAQQLCDVLWEALHEELARPDATRIAELSERLAEVSSTVAMLVSTTPATAPSPEPLATTVPDASVPNAPVPDAPAPNAPAPGPATPGPATHDPAMPNPAMPNPAMPYTAVSDTAVPGRPGPDRRTPPEPSRPVTPQAHQPIPTRAGEYTFTKLVDEQEPAAPVEPLATVQPIQPEIEIRDVRREEGPSAWVSSVGRLLSRHAEDGLPFAVLLVEIVDVARLERSETTHDLHGLVAKVEHALGRGMRVSDRLSRETFGRYWLVAPETNGTGARMLAERLARLVRTSATHRGVPMEVAIGIAVCPDDGTEAPALAARADLGVYSARATGRSIAHTDPPPAS